MDTGWIEAVMRVNRCIIASEAHLSTQAAHVVRIVMAGQDSGEAEESFTSSRRSLIMLRMARDELLRQIEFKG